MEGALQKLVEQGLAGAFLVLFVLAIIYLNKKREESAEARLAENRETLTLMAQVNGTITGLKDAVSGLSTNLASLTATTQTMHADSRAALEQTRQRDDRVERMIEQNGETIRNIRSAVDEMARDVDRLQDRTTAAGR